MSIGSCLLANEPIGIGEAMIQRRIEGKSWKEIADEFALPNPSAARKAFQKATGITDFKVKGKALAQAVQDMSAKAAQTGIYAAKNAIKIVDTAMDEAPSFIAQTVTPKWKSTQEIADEVGFSHGEILQIVKMHEDGYGYLKIQTNLSSVSTMEKIDKVVWNHLIKKNEGKTWAAYLEKPTSQEGFQAVKKKVLDLKAKGLSIEDITKIKESPPESVIDAIIKDKWTMPSPGSKTPSIPPPPPQVFGGTTKASTGTNFRRHSDGEMMDWINGLGMDLTPDQKDAISNYTGSGYHSINGALRGTYGYTVDPSMKRRVNNLDGTMRPIPFDTQVTRNITGTEAFGGMDPSTLVGTVFSDKGYLSTTIQESGVFGGNVQMILNVPKGSKGRYVRPLGVSSEYELLLARETRIVITRVELRETGGYYGKQYIVHGEVQ